MRLLDRIAHWAAVAPHHPAHVSAARTLTYGELWHRSGQLATYLHRTLRANGQPIMVRGHKEPEMLVAFFGAVRAGHPYIPIDLSLPEERVERIRLSAGAVSVLHANALPCVSPGAPDQSDDVLPDPAWQLPIDAPFYIIYTSGSTGDPKGVQVSLGCLESFLAWMEGEHGFRPQGELFLNQAPFSFDLSVMDLYLSLSTGGTLHSIDRVTMENPSALFAELSRSAITTWVSTPSFALMCLAERTFATAMLPHLSRFIFCGEALPPDCAARLLERFPGAEVWNTYGPTEATVATTSVRVDGPLLDRYNPLPVGYVKPDTKIIVTGEDGQPLSAGERGEITVIGSNVALGYLNNPDQTSKAFFTADGQRGYRTGDWGRITDGLLFWEGRIDFQVKLHGYRIELGDVESHLRAVPGVEDAVVVPYVRDGRPEWLAAFIIADDRFEGTDFTRSQTIRQALGARLPTYMLPRTFLHLASYPMTPNGKADRRQLEAMIK